MCIVGLCFYAWAATRLVEYGASIDDIILRVFDTITIVVPPALTGMLAATMLHYLWCLILTFNSLSQYRDHDFCWPASQKGHIRV